MLRKDRRQEKGTTKDEMVGWRHQLNGHEFEQTPEDSEGQGKPGMPYSQRVAKTRTPLSN